MSEWWTYSLGDFLLFSPETYYRLIALHNRALWPAQIAAMAAAAAVMILALRRTGPAAALVILSLAWLASGIGFHGLRYPTINWAADWFALGFAGNALVLAVVAWRGQPAWSRDGLQRKVGGSVLATGCPLYPLLAPLAGRPLEQAEVFGVMPDPTVVATLGIVALLRGPSFWLLLPIPLLWCVVGGATLIAMAAPHAFLLPLSGILAVGALAFGRRRVDG